ncbi:hypothetical protein PF005_g30508 [Phytophthora fragariae]|uniref:Uncharacterized protein n=2 Tax=Phytophthora TaxID=4783 RepID=A0A6A3H285_9STRA|nr:hypothetical protein PF003_g40647 [Phytophthora fragariae]KAE8960360.1 hypothetical protein PR001_g30409 [Phytophthora rubi]KAE8875228.1 hypothetical protein PF003_g40649 [Phytophthora fragariae]KAE8875241.1 hypothetical protein PF003_g40651 [Phytophthora fragariae]KAE8875807.1 hypothetical protein PF003_g40090 [Phytophthora fragariae]
MDDDGGGGDGSASTVGGTETYAVNVTIATKNHEQQQQQ